MHEVITFTPEQFIVWVLAICSGISVIAGAISWLVKGINKAKQPQAIQNERLDSLEATVSEHDKLLRQDKERFDLMEEGNRITQKAILALLSHGIDGNEIDGMKAAKDELQSYLINR